MTFSSFEPDTGGSFRCDRGSCRSDNRDPDGETRFQTMRDCSTRCGQPKHHSHGFRCENGRCERVKESPDAVSVFHSRKECARSCAKNPTGHGGTEHSYVCSPNLGCHIDKRAPDLNDPDGARYANQADCERSCTDDRYQSYVCSPGLGCHSDRRAPDENAPNPRFSKKNDCELSCSSDRYRSFVCSQGLGCHSDRRAPDEGATDPRYSKKKDCEAACSAKPAEPPSKPDELPRCWKNDKSWCYATGSVQITEVGKDDTYCCCENDGDVYSRDTATCGPENP